MLPLAQALPPALWGLATSFALCLLLVLTKRWHGRLTLDSTAGVQKFHTAPTPRVGGIPIAIGLVVAWSQSSADIKALLGPLLVAGLPAFIFGAAEDLTKRVGVRERLLATMVSGALACWLTGVSLTRVNVWGLDELMTFLPVSVMFTAFAVGGAANAVNIIDGFNGLASGTVVISLAAMGLIAHQVGDGTLAQLCLLLAAVTAGFWVVNFPLGKIFLGDGGAYLLGFLMAWVSVMLPMRNPGVSVWASLLACGYPILETFFSMWRKHRRVGHHPGQPDRVHLHMLMFSRVSRFVFRGAGPALKNGLTSPTLWPYAVLCGGLAVVGHASTPVLIASWTFCALAYHVTYMRLTQFRWCLLPATTASQRYRPEAGQAIVQK